MTAKTPSSKRAKGRRGELRVAEIIRQILKIDAKRMPMSGSIEGFKSDIYAPELNLTMEVKTQEKVKLWQWWQQAKRQEKPFRPACLCVSANHRPVLAIMELEELLKIIALNKKIDNESKDTFNSDVAKESREFVKESDIELKTKND